MKLTHRQDETSHTLAEDVRFADGFFAKRIGLMGKRPLREGEALVFRFSDAAPRHIHTVFVRAPIDVVWIEREQVAAVETMRPWRLGTSDIADTIVELPGGAADAVRVGDTVRLDRQ